MEDYFPESSVDGASSPSLNDFPDLPGMDMTPELFVQMGHISGPFSRTAALAFIHNGAHILSGNGDGNVKLWETETGRELRTFRCADDVTHLDVSRDERYLITGDMSHLKNVNLWDLATGKKLSSYEIRDGCNGTPVRFCQKEGICFWADAWGFA